MPSPLSEAGDAVPWALPRTLGRIPGRDKRYHLLTAEITVGRGRSSRTTPPLLRVPARHASGAGRGISRGLRCTGLSHQGTGRWDPAVIRPTLTVTVGQATTVTGAALHSVKSRTMELWRSHRRRAGRAAPPAGVSGCGRRSFDISVGGTDVRRIAGHMAAAQPSWMGGNPRTGARPPALLSCGGSNSRRQSARGSGSCGPCGHCRREHGCRLTYLPPVSIGLEPGEHRPGGRGFRGDGLRRHGLRGNEVLMCGSPHAARRRTRSPVARAFRTAAPRIRCMRSEQSPPAMGQSGQLTACDRQQRTIVGAVCQLVEHVEPLPHSLPEDLAQNLVHLATPPFRARFTGLEVCAPGRIPRTTVLRKSPPTFEKWRSNKVGRAEGWIKPAMGCAALIGRAMTVSGTF